MTVDFLLPQTAHLELLGIGSLRHQTFKTNLLRALEELQLSIPITEVTELADLLNYDISGIPALAINGRIVFQREVPSVEDLKIALSVLMGQSERKLELDELVVPTDFSSVADNAYQYALELARKVEAKIRLVHIHQEVSALPTVPHLMSGVPGAAAVKQDLLRIRAAEARKGTPPVELEEELSVGRVNEELYRLSRTPSTDLMVLGTTGEGNSLDRMGGHASAVARRAHCPVLLVPQGAVFQPFRRIVFASKLLPGEESVWPRAIELAARFQAELHFVHVRTDEVNGYQLGKISEGRYPTSKETVFRLSTIRSSNVVGGLNDYVQQHEADLLIMATTHRNFLQDMLHRSATHRMTFASKIPLLVLHFSLPDSY